MCMSTQNYDRRGFLKAVSIGSVSLALEGCVNGSGQPESGRAANKAEHYIYYGR